MSFQDTPGGTRGARTPGSNPVTRALMRAMTSWHRRSGDKFQGMDLLYLTTVGAKTGQKRQSAVARFPDGKDAWLVVASAGGSATPGTSRKPTAPFPSSGSPAPTEPGEPRYRGPVDARALEGGFTDRRWYGCDQRGRQSQGPFRHRLDMIS